MTSNTICKFQWFKTKLASSNSKSTSICNQVEVTQCLPVATELFSKPSVDQSNLANLLVILDQSSQPGSSTSSSIVSLYDVQNTTETNHLQLNTGNTSSLYYQNYFSPSLQYFDDTIWIPEGIVRVLEREIPTKLLKAIHKDKTTAIELCLLFIQLLRDGKTRSLKAEYLRNYFSNSMKTYENIRNALVSPVPTKGPIVFCDYYYQKKKKCYHYLLLPNYSNKNTIPYKMESKLAQRLYDNETQRMKITSKCFKMMELLEWTYKYVSVPTRAYAEEHMTSLALANHVNKNGQLIRTKRQYRPKNTKVAYVEDSLKVYKQLVLDRGLIIPRLGSEEAGGRVYDSFNMMPSEIRKLVKLKGEQTVTLDFKCLHPNIAMTWYGGKQKYITHQKVADALGIDLLKVKTQHLSFFNMDVNQMKHTPLWKYYSETEPEALEMIVYQKEAEKDYAITSQYLTSLETAIMTDIVTRLVEDHKIPTLYIFDAIMVPQSKTKLALKIMNEVAQSYNVYTTAAIS